MKSYSRHALMVLCTIILSATLAGCTGGKPRIPDNQQNYRFHASLTPIMQDAARGNANAQYTLGYRYYYGIGVEENIGLARYWFSEAARQKQPLAIQALADIAKWDLDNQSNVSRQYISRPAFLPPPPTNRHKYAELLTGQQHHTQRDLTLQLYDTRDREKAEQFIEEHDLDDARIVEATVNGDTYYEITYGKYSSHADAKQAINDLPSDIKATKPSVRPIEE